MGRTREYRKGYIAYLGARNRCTNPNNKDYTKYGGRGIEFKFTSFSEWCAELGPKPTEVDKQGRSLYSVDRIRNEGHYEPGNIRWATAKEQGENRRKSGVLASFTTEELVQELNKRGLIVSRAEAA